ncbi:MAG TPA: family 16 glycoside hydrolase [Chitinophagaceae bacterium]|nr:family 16 glycoside hydrolase [Chitinophagaceae bacterium]
MTSFFQKKIVGMTMLGAIAAGSSALAQTGTPLTDLSLFQAPGKTWRTAGDVRADLNQANVLQVSNGTGVLVNLPDKNNHGQDLLTVLQHGDADIELEYMMAKGSNSGIYLQGRYELQLMDGWGQAGQPKPGDNGGIYQRWDESRGKGNEGFEGTAPRQNVSKAPGTWQKLRISFQAPRFNAAGQKTENARILRVDLNGVTIHENVELTGPTRGSLGAEVAEGPLRIQGDHGAVAFRNINITPYGKPRPELTNLRYSVYKGNFDKEPDLKKLPPEAEGSSVILTSGVSNLNNEFLIRYTGTLKVQEPGEYRFNLSVPGGGGLMRINNVPVVQQSGWNGRGTVVLQKGEFPFELLYNKNVDWARPALGLAVAGPGIREYIISDANTGSSDPTDPILVNAPENTVLRSFMDIPGKRIVHAVNVGSREGVHYTYDLDNGALVQVWRGGFLDATPMWHDRGDGSSRPTGALLRLGRPAPALAVLASAQADWLADTANTAYRPLGYALDEADRPVFRYSIYGATVNDAVRVLDGAQGLRREISIDRPVTGMYLRLAAGRGIEDLGNGLYLVDDKSYYLRIDEGREKAQLRTVNGGSELLVPITTRITYSLLF